jgi:sugar phosphate isomerase/epimerase
MEQCADILKYAVSPALDDFGVIATVEPLVKGETPMLNTTEDGVTVAKLADKPNIKVMVDLYHSANEDKTFDKFPEYKGYILHSHIGKPKPRVHPSPDDGYDYAPFFAALRSAGFNGRMSLEAGSSNPDYKTSLENAFKILEPLL